MQSRIATCAQLAIRQYVQTQFELDPNDLGIVPMKSAPPKELRRASWDGVCIVVLLER